MPANSMKEKLKNILPEDRIDEFLSIGRIKSIVAYEYFLKAGEVPNRIAFVSNGLFRYIYTNAKGDEFTKGIIVENFFLAHILQ